MPTKPRAPDAARLDRIVAEARRHQEARAQDVSRASAEAFSVDLRPVRARVRPLQRPRIDRSPQGSQPRQQSSRRQQLGAAVRLLPRQRALARARGCCRRAEPSRRDDAGAATHRPFADLANFSTSVDTAMGDFVRARPRVPRGPFGRRSSRGMTARLAADTVVALHFAFIAFVIAGGLLTFKHRRMGDRAPAGGRVGGVDRVHRDGVPADAVGKCVSRRGRGCRVHRRLRRALHRAAHLPGSATPQTQVGLGIGIVALNAAIYALAWRKSRRAPDVGREIPRST